MQRVRLAFVAALSSLALASLPGCAGTGTERSTGSIVDDAAITAKVKTALIQEPSVSALDIDVNTYRGVVQLSGFVETEAQADRAVETATDVAGVRSVENDMRVVPGRR
jgi:osmotically-inducible protein OsmY